MSDEFRLSVLGPIEVSHTSGVLPIPGVRQKKVLSLLVLNLNRLITFDRLVDELWERPPLSSRQQIHNVLGGLRRALAPVADFCTVTTADHGYRLEASPDVVDTTIFTALIGNARAARSLGNLSTGVQYLREALRLWRGPAFGGLDSPTITSAAVALEEQRLTAAEMLALLQLRAGSANAVISDLVDLVPMHPLREDLRSILMIALCHCGRQSEALALYDQGRRLLADDLGLDPGAGLQGVHSAILHGDHGLEDGLVELESRRFHGAPEPATASPHTPVSQVSPAPRTLRSFLPRDTSEFSGRSAEVSELITRARMAYTSSLVITSIDGMGGIGKTSLAVHAAHHLTPEYPDGQYFVDLHGFTPGHEPLTSSRALDVLLQNSGVPPELIPMTLDGKSALWRSHMVGKRALVIIDNVVNAPQARPLLPGASDCLVIITSRRRLAALEGAVPMSLDVLPREDAAELFTHIAGQDRVGADPAILNSVVDLCGRLPLAVRIAAARLRDRRSWTMGDLVRRLRDYTSRTRFLSVDDRCVTATLRLSYRYLSDDQRRIFRLLSVHPGPEFDAFAVAAMAGISVDDASDHLERLFDDNLLIQHAAGRFHFHDLVHDCARQLLSETDEAPEVNVATHRLLDYYLGIAHSWSTLIGPGIYRDTPQVGYPAKEMPHVDNGEDARKALRTEHAVLISVARYAAESGWDRHAWQLACVLHPYLRLLNYGDAAYGLFEGACAAARREGDRRGESAARNGLAVVCSQRGLHDEARAHLAEAISLSREAGDKQALVRQLIDLGNVHLTQDNFHEALANIHAGRDIILATAGPDDHRLAIIANNLGAIYRDLGDWDRALELLSQALVDGQDDESVRFRACVLWNMGTVFHSTGDQDRALATFEQAVSDSRSVVFRHGEALGLVGLSMVSRTLGDAETAVELAREAVRVCRNVQLKEALCEALNALGEALVLTEDLDHATAVYKQAVDAAERYELPRFQARAFEGLAHIAQAQGDAGTARTHWQTALATYRAGMADATYAKAHLDGGAQTSCLRCQTPYDAGSTDRPHQPLSNS